MGTCATTIPKEATFTDVDDSVAFEENHPFSDLPQLIGPDERGFYYHERDKEKAVKQIYSHIEFKFKYNAIDYEQRHNEDIEDEKVDGVDREYTKHRYEWVYVAPDMYHVDFHRIKEPSYFDLKRNKQETLPEEYEKIRKYLADNDPIPPYFLRRSKMADMVLSQVLASDLCKERKLKCRIATRCIGVKFKQKINHPALLIWKQGDEFCKYNDRPVVLIHLTSIADKYKNEIEIKEGKDRMEIQCIPINKYQLDRDEWKYDYEEQILHVENGLIDIAHFSLKYEMDSNYEYGKYMNNCRRYMAHLCKAFNIIYDGEQWIDTAVQLFGNASSASTQSIWKKSNKTEDIVSLVKTKSVDVSAQKSNSLWKHKPGIRYNKKKKCISDTNNINLAEANKDSQELIISTDDTVPAVFEEARPTETTSDKVFQLLKTSITQALNQQAEDIITTFGSGRNNTNTTKQQTQQSNGGQGNEQQRKRRDDNNSNNNNNGLNNNSGDDGKDNSDKYNHRNSNSLSDEQDEEKEIDRFFRLLLEAKSIDDNALSMELKTHSSNTFIKVNQAIEDLNTQMKRISNLLSHSVTRNQSVDEPTVNGYSTNVSASDTEYIVEKVTVNNHQSNSKPKRKKRRRKNCKKKNSSKKRLVNIQQYEYEQSNVEYTPNIENEQKIKSYILTERWYDAKITKHVRKYGVKKSNDRVTLSLENSEFMRRCEGFVAKLKNKNEIDLIAMSMRDNENRLDVQYLLVVTIDDSKHIDIGVSFAFVENFNESGIVVSGYHMNKTNIILSSPCQLDEALNDFKIDYLNVYGQKEEYYKDKYDALKLFVRKFTNAKLDTFDYHVWKEQATQLMSCM